MVKPLTDELLVLLQESHMDFTSFFRSGQAGRGDAERHVDFCRPAGFDRWLSRLRDLNLDPESMDRANPVYIPATIVKEALTAATAGDLQPLEQLMAALSAPYDERPGLQRYASPAPEDFGAYRTFCGT